MAGTHQRVYAGLTMLGDADRISRRRRDTEREYRKAATCAKHS